MQQMGQRRDTSKMCGVGVPPGTGFGSVHLGYSVALTSGVGNADHRDTLRLGIHLKMQFSFLKNSLSTLAVFPKVSHPH